MASSDVPPSLAGLTHDAGLISPVQHPYEAHTARTLPLLRWLLKYNQPPVLIYLSTVQHQNLQAICQAIRDSSPLTRIYLTRCNIDGIDQDIKFSSFLHGDQTGELQYDDLVTSIDLSQASMEFLKNQSRNVLFFDCPVKIDNVKAAAGIIESISQDGGVIFVGNYEIQGDFDVVTEIQSSLADFDVNVYRYPYYGGVCVMEIGSVFSDPVRMMFDSGAEFYRAAAEQIFLYCSEILNLQNIYLTERDRMSCEIAAALKLRADSESSLTELREINLQNVSQLREWKEDMDNIISIISSKEERGALARRNLEDKISHLMDSQVEFNNLTNKLQQELASTQASLAAVEHLNAKLLQSTSWRLTSPLRSIVSFVKKVLSQASI